MGAMGLGRRMGLSLPGNLQRPILLLRPLIPIPVIEPGLEHALAQTALFQKILFQPAELLVNQVVENSVVP